MFVEKACDSGRVIQVGDTIKTPYVKGTVKGIIKYEVGALILIHHDYRSGSLMRIPIQDEWKKDVSRYHIDEKIKKQNRERNTQVHWESVNRKEMEAKEEQTQLQQKKELERMKQQQMKLKERKKEELLFEQERINREKHSPQHAPVKIQKPLSIKTKEKNFTFGEDPYPTLTTTPSVTAAEHSFKLLEKQNQSNRQWNQMLLQEFISKDEDQREGGGAADMKKSRNHRGGGEGFVEYVETLQTQTKKKRKQKATTYTSSAGVSRFAFSLTEKPVFACSRSTLNITNPGHLIFDIAQIYHRHPNPFGMTILQNNVVYPWESVHPASHISFFSETYNLPGGGGDGDGDGDGDGGDGDGDGKRGGGEGRGQRQRGQKGGGGGGELSVQKPVRNIFLDEKNLHQLNQRQVNLYLDENSLSKYNTNTGRYLKYVS